MQAESMRASSAEMQSMRTGGIWTSSYNYNHGSRASQEFMVLICNRSHRKATLAVRATVQGDNEDQGDGADKKKKNKQSLIGSIADALDFSQVRSERDAQLLEDARAATKAGERMSREQYAALRRKIGGTYKDFFKAYVEGNFQSQSASFISFSSSVCAWMHENRCLTRVQLLLVVDGEYVEEGWVDKTCKICKKDTRGEPRNVDSFGRYAHVACLQKSKSGNFFTRLFNR